MIEPSFEYVEMQDQSTFRCVHRSCDTFANEHPMHFHPAYELTWIKRSSGTRYVGDSVERYLPDDLVLCGPNLPHCWRDDPCSRGSNAPEWIIAQFDPGCFGEGFLLLPEATGLRNMLEDARRGIAFGQLAAAAIDHRFTELVSKTGMARLLGLLEILEQLTHFDRIMLAATDYHVSNDVDQNLVGRLEQVQRYIIDRLTGEVNQSEIAAELGMSASAFSKFFRAATGRTFMSLVKLLRINEACRRLAISNDRITGIALDCGYQHTSHFDQHFHELKGMSPSEYRRRMQMLEQYSAVVSGR